MVLVGPISKSSPMFHYDLPPDIEMADESFEDDYENPLLSKDIHFEEVPTAKTLPAWRRLVFRSKPGNEVTVEPDKKL